MNRRKFLKAGLIWLPAFPAIVHAQSEDWFRVASEGAPAASGAWTPSTPSNTLKQWLKGDAIAGTDGDLLSTWPNSAGTDATSSGSGRPTLHTGASGLNGLNIVQFNGTSNYMHTANWASAQAQSYSVLVLVKYAATPGAIKQNVMDNNNANAGATRGIITADSAPSLQMYGGTSFQSTGDFTSTFWIKGYFEFNGGSSKYQLKWTSFTDGPTTFGASPGTDTIQGLTLGAAYDTTSSPANIKLAEIALWNGLLSSGDITSAFSYLATKWGV